MKIALIYYNFEPGKSNDGYLSKHLSQRGHECSQATDIDSFISRHGHLYQYDVIFTHPGINKQKETLKRLSEEYPDIPRAIISFNCGDYITREGLSIFDMNRRNNNAIYSFLETVEREKRLKNESQEIR